MAVLNNTKQITRSAGYSGYPLAVNHGLINTVHPAVSKTSDAYRVAAVDRMHRLREQAFHYSTNTGTFNYVKEQQRMDLQGKMDTSMDPLNTIVKESPAGSLVVGLNGLVNLSTSNANPEPNVYGKDRVVPTIRGGMVSAGGPKASDAYIADIMAIPRIFQAADKSPMEQKLWDQSGHNPYIYRKQLHNLSAGEKTQLSIEQKSMKNKKGYNDFLSMMQDAGVGNEQQVLRDAVIGPDGQVSLNPTVNAALANMGYAGDSLRLLDLTGIGLGDVAAAGGRLGAVAAKRAIESGLENLGGRAVADAVASAARKVGQTSLDIATAPASMALGVGVGGGSLTKAAREAAQAKALAEEHIVADNPKINSALEKTLAQFDELLGTVEEPTKAGVTKATRTTGFKLPAPDPKTGKIEPFDISSDEIVTNTDFQAASLGIHHGQNADDKIVSAAMDEINDSLGKKLKDNKEGYRVFMDPVIPDGSSLAKVIRQRFNVLDKDGKERFIQARVKDGYSEKDAANLWKGLGSKTDKELEDWWVGFRKNNPEIPWDIQAINSEKHPDLWAHVGGIDFDHVFSAAGKNGTGKLENFVPIGHYLNRMKGKRDGPEFLDYLAQNKPAIFAYLGGYDGAYAKSLVPAMQAKRKAQPATATTPILGNSLTNYMRELQGK